VRKKPHPADGWMLLEDARSTLLLIWMLGSGLVFAILTAQSIFGRYGDNLQAVWSWFIPTVIPTISLMLGVLGATAMTADADTKVVKVFFYRLSKYLSLFYLTILFLTVVLEPFTQLPAIKLYTTSNYWLGPLQGLVVGVIGVLFMSKEEGVR